MAQNTPYARIPGPHQRALTVCTTLSDTVHEMSESLGQVIDAKDPFTKNHSDEVAIVSHALALAMGFGPGFARIVHLAGHLHDIGKIGVPDAVLSKAGPLNDVEWSHIRRHPGMGAAILHPVSAIRAMSIPELVHCHHERWDGRGYPSGLAGADIPIGARILAVADTVSAMLQDRPYRKGLTLADTFGEIERCAGAQFDPAIVDAFLSIREALPGLLRSGHPSGMPWNPDPSADASFCPLRGIAPVPATRQTPCGELRQELDGVVP